MIHNKHLNKITVLLVCLSLIGCGLMVYFAGSNTNTKVMAYESKLFGEEILTIDIRVDEAQWQEMLDHATAKEYISADLVINGEQFSTVGLRTKGNSSLTQVAHMEDSDRYSIQFKFGYFEKGQTCYGLDTLCINNLVGDTTYMKDYISYDIMKCVGVPTPLMNYAVVTVNGEDFGFYLALERYEKSFLDRVYQTSGGQLYNVKTQMGQGGNVREENVTKDRGLPQSPATEATAKNPEEVKKNSTEGLPSPRKEFNPQDKMERNSPMQGGPNSGKGGGNLVYTDDDINSYGSIFENTVFSKNSDKDKQKVITAIKNLNEGTNLEQYFDVDQVLRYLAAHTAVVNLDSYSSGMAQNYYIYENDGKITILPWDYGLAFGGFQGGNADSVINFPIDTPVSGVSMEERPLMDKLLEVPEYRENYHEYLQQIVEEYFASGIFEERVAALDAKINDYVKKDVSSFTTYEEYEASLRILIQLGKLRAQSIEGQLDGSIPSTTEGQAINKDALIDASDINISALGSIMSGNRNQEGGRFGTMTDLSVLQQAMPILKENGGVISDEVREKLLELGLTEEEVKQMEEMANNMPRVDFGGRDGDFSPEGMPQGQENTAPSSTADPTYIAMVIVSLLVLGGAIIFLLKAKKTY